MLRHHRFSLPSGLNVKYCKRGYSVRDWYCQTIEETKMKNFFVKLIGPLYCALFAATSFAQTPTVLPSSPNSSDTIIVRMQFGAVPIFTGDSYRVEMVANRIRVILGANDRSPFGTGIPVPFNFEIGKLPAGTYAVDAFDTDKATGSLVLLGSSSTFTVSNGRIGKTSPFVALNVADHWWSPAESGWGLFIWHDRLDHVLAAWFTYGADNKPVWYTVQAGAWTTPYDYQGQIFQSTGPAFSAFVPGSTVQMQAVGTAKLSLGPDTGTFTYTLNGVTQTKNIARFKP